MPFLLTTFFIKFVFHFSFCTWNWENWNLIWFLLPFSFYFLFDFRGLTSVCSCNAWKPICPHRFSKSRIWHNCCYFFIDIVVTIKIQYLQIKLQTRELNAQSEPNTQTNHNISPLKNNVKGTWKTYVQVSAIMC